MKTALEGNENDEFDLFFQRLTWPILIPQYDFNIPVDPTYLSFKSFVLLNFMSKHELYGKYMTSFLKSVNKETFWHYIFDIINIVQLGLDSRKKKEEFKFTFFAHELAVPFLKCAW